MKQTQRDEGKRYEKRCNAMQPRTYRTKDVAAVQLADGEEVHRSYEQADPCGAADGREKQRAGVGAGMNDGVEKSQEQWRAKDDIHVLEVSETGHKFRVKNSVKESGDGKDETHKRTRSADVKECAVGTKRRTNQNESAEGANERGKRKEVRIAGANVMMAAREEVAELVGKKNGEEGEGEGETGEESGGMLVEEFVGADEFVDRGCLILGIGVSELSACREASAKREKEQDASEKESFGGRARRNGKVLRLEEGLGAPVNVDWNGA
jgi:hypothetical protein